MGDGWSKNNCAKDGSTQELIYDDNGSKKSFVCDADSFRMATVIDSLSVTLIGSACVSYTEGKKKKEQMCKNGNVVWCGSYGSLEDSRDGKTYKTVVIGTQTWMAENLNYEMQDSYCYNDSAKYCDKYGRLYKWNVAILACPSGWHLPTKAEFETLLATVGNYVENTFGGLSYGAGKMLKSIAGWNDYENVSGDGFDAYGFNAQPAGIRVTDWSDESFYDYEGSGAFFWSSTENGGNAGYDMGMGSSSDNVSIFNAYSNRNGLSVRCLQD